MYYKRPKNGQGQVPSGPGRLDCVPTIIELTRDCLGHRQSTQGLIITEKAEKSKGGNIIPICSILKRSLLICKTIVPNTPLTFSSVQSLSRVRLFATPWITAHQASLSITSSRSSPKLMSIESVMLSSHLILYHPLLLLPPIPPSIRVFSKESTLRMRWPKYWSFSFSISPSNEHPGLISLLAV